ncbi:YlaC family protein [Hafnia alvei]|uniref:YlaC family protein n=1 Tax=Hafnia alvei TaxID=569 RepID=UPI000E014085|nr:YlaC family protein [Hafnia alvei]STQ72736.1 Inner membrane protein ylaC [Hafnia alvei]
MSEIERILKEEIDRVNKAEHRDNRPRFSISFIKKHPGLFVGMYLAYAATLAVMLQSETLADVTWVMTLLFVGLNLFFFFDVNPRYHYDDIDVLDLRVCFNGEWYNTRMVPDALVDSILQSSQVDESRKQKLRAIMQRKPELSFYDIFAVGQNRSPV